MGILRNQEGASPGGGASPSNGTAPAQASGTPSSAPTIDVNAIAEAVTRQVNDSVFASLRRAGVLGDKQATKREPAESNGTATAPAAAMSEEHVGKLMRLNRALGAAGLTAEQESAVEKLFKADAPDDVAGWVSETVKALGFGKVQTQASEGVPKSVTPNPSPSSNGGAPGAPAPNYDDQPWARPADVVDRLVREKGYPRASRELREAMRRAMQGRRFDLPK